MMVCDDVGWCKSEFMFDCVGVLDVGVCVWVKVLFDEK